MLKCFLLSIQQHNAREVHDMFLEQRQTGTNEEETEATLYDRYKFGYSHFNLPVLRQYFDHIVCNNYLLVTDLWSLGFLCLWFTFLQQLQIEVFIGKSHDS